MTDIIVHLAAFFYVMYSLGIAVRAYKEAKQERDMSTFGCIVAGMFFGVTWPFGAGMKSFKDMG